jgi:hypothetical protein
MAQNVRAAGSSDPALRNLSMIASMIPESVARELDEEELGDRLVAAGRLLDQSRTATSVTIRKGLAELARETLTAQPRRVTEEQVRALMTKAARAATPADRDRYRGLAEQTKAQHPIAPRRRPPTVVKAGKDLGDLVPVYTATGELFGLVPREKIQPVTPITSADIAKARRRRGAR